MSGHRVLDAADVEVNAVLAHPVALGVLIDHRCAIPGVDEAEVIPARSRPLRHRVELAGVLDAAAVDDLPVIRSA